MEGDFLSDILSVDDLGNDFCMYLIVAPCGAGKTKFAIDAVASMWGDPQKSLYLIDTIAGKEQLLQNPKCQCYDREWRDSDSPDRLAHSGKVTVMTYAFFGALCKYYPYWYSGLDVIICDEIHKLFEMRLWGVAKKVPDEDNLYDQAWQAIFQSYTFGRVQTVVAMTATPQGLYNQYRRKYDDGTWSAPDEDWIQREIRLVPLHGIPRHYEQKNIHQYSNLTALCNKLPTDRKGIIYMSRISMMEKYRELLQNRGINAVSIWSPHNQHWWMSKQQHEVRNYIIENAAVPDDVDVLLINKSCETSINVKSHIDYIVVHSSDPDTQTQAIGRYRNDLDDLYVYDPELGEEIELPEKMLGVPLFKEDIVKFIKEQNIRDETGRLVGQPTFISYLKDSGYDVADKKVKGGKRYHIVTEKIAGTQNQNIIY